MENLVKKNLRREPIWIEHHVVLSESELDDVAIHSYREGFATCKNDVMSMFKDLPLEAVVKQLMLEKIEALEDSFSYLYK